MIVSHQKKIQHLLFRSGFAELPATVDQYCKLTITEAVNRIFNNSESYQPLSYIKDPLKGREEEVSNFKILKMILKSKGQTEELNIAWLDKMAESNASLREKMTLFWHNHFATSVPFAWLMQEQNNTLRTHALGSFRTLLHQVAKDPAMIIYLNNQQNKVRSPNENFAREVMELFTIGIGNYTESDVKEAARCFTGWSVNRHGKFELEENQHDKGVKTIFGKSGNFEGEDVLNMLLSNRLTAHTICKKIYKEFVSPTENEQHITELTEVFFKSDYNIGVLLRHLFTADWFYEPEHFGVKICSPTELLVRLKRYTGFIVERNRTVYKLQRVMGQMLFFPPNVAGWPGGRLWIDSTGLLTRLTLTRKIYQGYENELSEKANIDAQEKDSEQKKNNSKEQISSDWSVLVNHFAKLPFEASVDMMLGYFIQCDTNHIKYNKPILIDGLPSNKKLEAVLVNIFSTPEFQLI